MIQLNTFSIVAHCPRTGMLGVAVSTAVPAVGGLCPYIRPRVGGVSTQSWVNPYLAIEALDLMHQGRSGPEALDAVISRDDAKDFRQIGYPRDMLYGFGLSQPADGLDYDIRSKTPPDDGLVRLDQFEASSFFTVPPTNAWRPKPKIMVDSTFLFLNFAAVPVPVRGVFDPEYPMGSDFKMLEIKRHFAGFAPYFFEEDWAGRIKFLQGRPLEMGIFRSKR